MEDYGGIVEVSVIWRGNRYVVEMDSRSSLKDLGEELRRLTDVKRETIRLIVPRVHEKGSKLLFPFSDEHSRLSLQEASILEGKPIRMMGVTEDEAVGVRKDEKIDMRILGFEEEERRLRQKMLYVPHSSIKLPQGPYVFCDFRTLHIPGVELNPPPSEALKRMHMLAADPGIVAIMNKHRWRVGIMSELAPVGYVGVSPKCLLGFNKDHGEEISLRLRTDDLKGFRKYESIKKTLLHELAHMVYSEHDENFYALNKQLNQEAAVLDWTKSGGHTLNGTKNVDSYNEYYYSGQRESFSQKLGGSKSDQLANASASSVAAAYRRSKHTAVNNISVSKVCEEPDPDDQETGTYDTATPWNKLEPDPDDTIEDGMFKTYPDFSGFLPTSRDASGPGNQSGMMTILDDIAQPDKVVDEPDPDDSKETKTHCQNGENEERSNNNIIPNENLKGPVDASMLSGTLDVLIQKDMLPREPDPDDSHVNEAVEVKLDLHKAEPDPDDNPVRPLRRDSMCADEPDPDDQEIQRIQDSVTIICNRLKNAIDVLQTEVNPVEATKVLQTLFKIIRNVIEHPDEMKFKRLRKGNSAIQRNLLNYKAAVKLLSLVGFIEDMISDETGNPEAYLVLKRNDPGLLWLAKSSLEARISASSGHHTSFHASTV